MQVSTPDAVDWDDPTVLAVLQPGAPLGEVALGKLSATAGRGAVEYVLAAVELAKAGQVAGIVTAPLNKEAIHLAGYSYPGHTELLADQFGVRHYSLVLSARGQFVFHVTTHVSLREALDLITYDRVLSQIRLAHLLAAALGRGSEPIVVSGVNPHAGEGGLFGREEIEIIAPAVAAAKAQGIPALGPLAADVVFPRAARGQYAFVIAMYHDQGHAVFKTLYFDEGVNVTVGLPVIRTSVDHGTAFDIAGQGIARDDSLVEAIRLAAQLGPQWGLPNRLKGAPRCTRRTIAYEPLYAPIWGGSLRYATLQVHLVDGNGSTTGKPVLCSTAPRHRPRQPAGHALTLGYVILFACVLPFICWGAWAQPCHPHSRPHFVFLQPVLRSQRTAAPVVRQRQAPRTAEVTHAAAPNPQSGQALPDVSLVMFLLIAVAISVVDVFRTRHEIRRLIGLLLPLQPSSVCRRHHPARFDRHRLSRF